MEFGVGLIGASDNLVCIVTIKFFSSCMSKHKFIYYTIVAVTIHYMYRDNIVEIVYFSMFSITNYVTDHSAVMRVVQHKSLY